MKRFAFYGRVSTEDQQDPASSHNWQLARARQVIEPDGEVVAEFFDIGQSRSLPWKRRPEAARLLATFADSRRGFDAVVIGEPQRAFYGNQFGLTFPVFTHYGVGLWVPEVGGAVDAGSEAHDLVMSLYGGMSKGERMRIKTRVRSAMAAQASIEGRFLGGRPPYGYRLVNIGPHPNPAKAALGQQLRQLSPDPVTAPVVQRIFGQFCTGDGLGTIAAARNADGILSPAGYDPDRNRHRASSHGAWAKSAVRAILNNPRYTGFQVWNKQRKDEVLVDVEDVALGHETRMRWNHTDQWVWSTEPTHEAIITPDQFETAQAMFGANKRRGPRQTGEGRHYLLSGLIFCAECGRRMQGQWHREPAYYRCRFNDDYPQTGHPKSIAIRESALTDGLDRWLASLFDKDHLDATCDALAGTTEPDPAAARDERRVNEAIAECDRKLAGYRALLDQDPDIVPVAAKWIAETEHERRRLQSDLRRHVPLVNDMTSEQVLALVVALKDVVAVLTDAAPDAKAQVYRDLGIELRYSRTGQVHIESRPGGVNVRVGGGT